MRVYLAGAEMHGRPELLLGQKVKYVLGSYYYMRDKRDGGIERLKGYKEAGCEIFVDSGAHTFFSELGMGHGVVVTKETKTQESYEEYFEKYLTWLLTVKDIVSCYVELDIQEIVGQVQIWEWRRRMREVGLDPIVVLHPKASDNVDKEWDRLTSEFTYCAIEGSLPTNRYVGWLTMSEKKKVRVHGFAMTKVDEMRRCKFYSVDSTSWTSGGRFGGTYFYRGGGRMEAFGKDEKRGRVRFKQSLIKAGIDWEALERDDNTEIDRMNCFAWKQFADWADRYLLTNYEREVEGKGQQPSQPIQPIGEGRIAEGTGEFLKGEIPAEALEGAVELPERKERVEEGSSLIKEGSNGSVEGGNVGGSSDSGSYSGVVSKEVYKEDKGSEGGGEGKPKLLNGVADTFVENKGNIQQILKENPLVEEQRRKTLSVVKKGNIDTLKHGRYASDPVIYCRENCPKFDSCPHKIGVGSICYFDTRWRPIVERIQSTQPEVILEALVMFVRTQLPRLAKNQGFESIDGGYIDKNVTILADRIFQWLKDIHVLMTPKQPLVQVGGDLTIQKIENIVDRLPADKAKKIGDAICEVECIDTEGDKFGGEESIEAEVVKEVTEDKEKVEEGKQ
jgi:hypothetical protein